MKLRLAVFKEVHRQMTDKPQTPLHEGIRGDKYRCHLSLPTDAGGRELKVSANSPASLRREVDMEIARLQGEVDETSFRPPEGVEARTFLSLREDSRESNHRKKSGLLLVDSDGRPVSKRYDSSGKMMIAEPLPLNNDEIGEFSDGIID